MVDATRAKDATATRPEDEPEEREPEASAEGTAAVDTSAEETSAVEASAEGDAAEEASTEEDAAGEASAGEDAAEEETAGEGPGTRVYFFRRNRGSKVEHILGSAEADVDLDRGTVEFSEAGDLGLKVGDLVSSRLIASEPIQRVERETRGDTVDCTVWYEREE